VSDPGNTNCSCSVSRWSTIRPIGGPGEEPNPSSGDNDCANRSRVGARRTPSPPISAKPTVLHRRPMPISIVNARLADTAAAAQAPAFDRRSTSTIIISETGIKENQIHEIRHAAPVRGAANRSPTPDPRTGAWVSLEAIRRHIRGTRVAVPAREDFAIRSVGDSWNLGFRRVLDTTSERTKGVNTPPMIGNWFAHPKATGFLLTRSAAPGAAGSHTRQRAGLYPRNTSGVR
jgi:hypothetical protein